MGFKTYYRINNETGEEYPVYKYYNIFSGKGMDMSSDYSLTNLVNYAEEIATELSIYSGFPIDKELVKYQIGNWCFAYKRRFRDDEGGYHLYFDSNDSDFNISVSPLILGVDWQNSYLITDNLSDCDIAYIRKDLSTLWD